MFGDLLDPRRSGKPLGDSACGGDRGTDLHVSRVGEALPSGRRIPGRSWPGTAAPPEGPALGPQRRVARIRRLTAPRRVFPGGELRSVLGALGRTLAACSRTRPTTCATSSQPTHPASWRAYSSRRVESLICATIGTHRRSELTLPSALSRSCSARAVRIANSGTAAPAAQPGHEARRRRRPAAGRMVHAVGGHRDEALSRKVLLTLEGPWSAAAWPALSPSNT